MVSGFGADSGNVPPVADEDLATLDWKRLGEYLKHRRWEDKRRTQEDLAAATGTTVSTIQNYEGGRVPTAWPRKLSRVVDELGWAPGSEMDVLRGGEPTLKREPESHGAATDLVFILRYVHQASPRTHAAMRTVLETDPAVHPEEE